MKLGTVRPEEHAGSLAPLAGRSHCILVAATSSPRSRSETLPCGSYKRMRPIVATLAEIPRWPWVKMRNLWLAAIGLELFLLWILYGWLPAWSPPLPAGKTILDPGMFMYTVDAHDRLESFVWPPVAILATLVVPLLLLRVTAQWMMAHAPPLRPPPKRLLRKRGILTVWLTCLLLLMPLTSAFGLTAGFVARCVIAMPLVLLGALWWLRALTHPRRSLLDVD